MRRMTLLRSGHGPCGGGSYFKIMNRLMPLDACLGEALNGLSPVSAIMAGPSEACGYILAEDFLLPRDMPATAEGLRAGFAVTAMDFVGASAGVPVPLDHPIRVVPGAALPPGKDAVLPEDATDTGFGVLEALRSVNPGEGVRHAGHDGRAGEVLARAGTRLSSRHVMIALQVGIVRLAIRRPRAAVVIDDPAQAAFLRGWLSALGADVVVGSPADLTLCAVHDHTPRLAMTPAETAWLTREGSSLIVSVPARFDGMIAAALCLLLPVMARLTGAAPAATSLQLARKLTSTVGLSELVLLTEVAGHWQSQPVGTVTLSGLAQASAFAILPPDSEGLPAGAPLTATPLDLPLG
jgi:molybdopterin molybdotransferase